MNTSVDVLAVMESASLSLFEACRNADARILDKARAEVAELIEAVGPALYELRDKSEAKKDLIAALARVKGA